MRYIFINDLDPNNQHVKQGDLDLILNSIRSDYGTKIDTANTLTQQVFNNLLIETTNTEVSLRNSAISLAVSDYIPKIQINQPNGVAGVNSDGKIPASLLPQYVDHVVYSPTAAGFPSVGLKDVIYTTDEVDGYYRWNGNNYFKLPSNPGSTDEVAEGVVNLYCTLDRVYNYSPVKSVSGRTGHITLSTNDIAGMPTKLSNLVNDLGLITAGGAPVQSVAGKSGDVVLLASDISGLSAVARTGAYDDLINKPFIPTTVSQLTNDSGYLTSATIPLRSVAGRTGDVVLSANDVSGLAAVAKSGDYQNLINKPSIPTAVSQLSNDAGYVTSVNFPVTSVNGRTGAVNLTANDISGLPVYLSSFYNDVGYIRAVEAPVQSVNGKTGNVNLDSVDLPNLIPKAWIGVPGGVASLDVYGKIPKAQIPLSFDDVLYFDTSSQFPATGEVGILYITAEANGMYRWTGSSYFKIPAAPGSTDSIPEGVSNLYFTYSRAASAAPVQSVAGKTGNVHLGLTDISGWATVAQTGSYLDLSNKPTIPTAVSQLSNDIGYLTSHLVTSVAGKTGAVNLSITDIGNVATVAVTGNYSDLTNRPNIPGYMSQLVNDLGLITAGGAPVQSVAGKTGNVSILAGDVLGLDDVYLRRDGLHAMTGELYTKSTAGNTYVDTDGSAIQIRNAGTSGDGDVAAISFLCQNNYAIKMHLRADGYFGIGGWSRPSWSWYSAPNGTMVAAGDVTAYSDPRLKEKFTKFENALDIIDQLNGGRFIWKHGIKHTEIIAGKKDIGILANEVQLVLPEIVHDSIDIDGEIYKTVAYDKLTPVLIEAIKELRAELRSLKDKM